MAEAAKSAAKAEEEVVIDASVWAEKLAELESGGNRSVQYLKPGRNRIRLLPGKPRPTDFYLPVNRTYRGQTRTSYVVKAMVMVDGEEPRICGVVLKKTVLKSIVNLLAEGYDLFGKNGFGVTIVKSGTGQDTSYSTMPSAKPVPIPDGIDEIPETLEDLVKSIMDADDRRANNPGGNRRSGEDEDTDEKEW